MSEDKIELLVSTVQKLYQRKAFNNIKKVYEKSHKADIAVVIESFEREEDILALFKLSGDPSVQAEILGFLNPKIQKIIIRHTDPNNTVDLLSQMESDDVADLLGELETSEANELLQNMGKDESEELVDLMKYPEDSAGGIMNSDFISCLETMTVEEVILHIQNEENENSVAFYIYVTNVDYHLVGVVSLKQLLLSKKSKQLKDLMIKEVISITVEASQEYAARLVERYDFLALPVVTKGNMLVGVITVDDVIDVIREEAEGDLLKMGQAGQLDDSLIQNLKGKFPWMGLSYLGGALCFCVIYFLGQSVQMKTELPFDRWAFASFIPTMLLLGGTVGNQVTTRMVSSLKASTGDGNFITKIFFQELTSTIIAGFVLSLLTMFIGFLFIENSVIGVMLSCSLFTHLINVIVMGALFPVLISRLGLNTSTISVPLFSILTDLIGVIILLGYMRLLAIS